MKPPSFVVPLSLFATCLYVFAAIAQRPNENGGTSSDKADLTALQGKWKLVEFTRDGKEQKVDMKFLLTVKDDVVVWTPWITGELEEGPTERFAFKLDASTRPRTLRLIKTIPLDSKLEAENITSNYGYELAKDTLKLTHDSGRPKQLPASFDTKGRRWHWTATFRKVIQ